MPIRPENRARYGEDWSAFSDRIRFGRAGSRCECEGECGRATHRGRCPNTHDGAAYGTGSVVVLTVAHLCHTPECREHVKAMCQGCHLHYDKGHHQDTAARTREATTGQGQMFPRENSRCPLVQDNSRLIREDGPEADGARRWAREVRTLARAAHAPLRRCPSDGCYGVTTAQVCPKCGAVVWEDAPDETAAIQRQFPVHARVFAPRACRDCQGAFLPGSGTQVYCAACGRERQARSARLSHARSRGEAAPTKPCETPGCPRRFAPNRRQKYCWHCARAGRTTAWRTVP